MLEKQFTKKLPKCSQKALPPFQNKRFRLQKTKKYLTNNTLLPSTKYKTKYKGQQAYNSKRPKVVTYQVSYQSSTLIMGHLPELEPVWSWYLLMHLMMIVDLKLEKKRK